LVPRSPHLDPAVAQVAGRRGGDRPGPDAARAGSRCHAAGIAMPRGRIVVPRGRIAMLRGWAGRKSLAYPI
jgi:hypothetical protein